MTQTAPSPAAIPPGSPPVLITSAHLICRRRRRRCWARLRVRASLPGREATTRIAADNARDGRRQALPTRRRPSLRASSRTLSSAPAPEATGRARGSCAPGPLARGPARPRARPRTGAAPRVGLERLGLTSAAVEGERAAGRAAAPGAGARRRATRARRPAPHGGRARGRPRSGPRAPRAAAPRAADLVLRERLVREVGERRSAPERERLLELSRRRAGSSWRASSTRAWKRAASSRRPRRRSAYPGDASRARRRRASCAGERRSPGRSSRRLRRVLAPELVDEPVDRDDLAATEQQKCQQRAWLAGRKVERCALPAHFERPEDPEFERLAHTANRRSTGVNRSSTARGESRRHRNRKEPSCSARSHEPRVSPR